jgi:hypothetical protein
VRRDWKQHCGKNDLAIHVIAVPDNEVECGLANCALRPLPSRVSLDSQSDLVDHGREVPGADKQDQGALCVSPREVFPDLVDRVREGLRALPDLALGDANDPVQPRLILQITTRGSGTEFTHAHPLGR